MKFVYKDLLKFFIKKPSVENLSEKLFQLGHEHEINDEIFYMDLTPNRGDCLSLKGLARDLNIFFESIEPYKIFEGNIEPLNIDFKNLSPEVCPKISFLEIEIEGDTNKYKPYLENYFSLLGNNKVNFFTDISNYISYEIGQPTHCFDASMISGELIFQNRICDTSFKTLLGSNVNLRDKNCIFSVKDEIISLAGVMGGMETACSTKTKKALIECAFFKPESIIGKSVKYNLVSDAAHRFERGVDIEAQENVLRRFIEIVRDHASIKNIKIQRFDVNKYKKKRIPIDVKRINKILGTSIEEEEYLIYLNKLGFIIEKEIIVPSYRHDILSQNDLAEEIARVIGFNKIKSSPLKISNETDKDCNNINKLKNYLIKNGFSEVINFPFSSSRDKESIAIDNPLDSSKNYLRTSLKRSLLDNLEYNERRQKDSIKFFEISDIYSNNKQVGQEKKLAIIISGRKDHNYIDFSKKLDNHYLTKLLSQYIDNSFFKIEEISRTEIKSKRKDKIYYTEISIDKIPKEMLKGLESNTNEINFIKYKSVSEFPSSTRDFSFSITDHKKYDTVIKYISDFNDKNLKDGFIFDFYNNKKSKEIKVGIRLIFQSVSGTLSDEDIQNSVNRLLKPIIDLKGVTIPGLNQK